MKFIACLEIVLMSLAFCIQEDTDYHLDRLVFCSHVMHSCTSGQLNIYCSCDQMCIYYDDCCFDAAAITEKVHETSETVIHHYLEMITCELITFKEIASMTQGVFMISSCPMSWNSNNIDTRKKCELDMNHDIRDMLPVFDIETNLTFKNRQCAECHQVQNYIPWLFEITCESEIESAPRSVMEALQRKIHSDKCTYQFRPPTNAPIHYCYQELDYAIIPHTLEHVQSSDCQNRVMSPIFVAIDNKNLSVYRNLQCFMEEYGPTYPEVLNRTFCAFKNIEEHAVMDSHTLSSLIDFSSLLRVPRKEIKCKENEIQLSKKIGCQRLYCPALSEPSGGRCVNITHTTNGVLLDLLLEVNKEVFFDRNTFEKLYKILDSLVSVLSNDTVLSNGYNYLHFQSNQIIKGTYLDSKTTCSIIRIVVPLKNIDFFDASIESQRLLIASFIKNYTQTDVDGSIITHIGHKENTSCKTNTSFGRPLYLSEMISVDNDLPCPAVKVQYSENKSASEVSVRDVLNGASNESLYFRLGEVVISPMDVVYENGEHFVCVDVFSSKYQHVDHEYDGIDVYRNIINIACISISIICLIYCLVQNCVIPGLRDGKSDLLMVLVIVLLFTQTCFLILPLFDISSNHCAWLGVIHHFAWLCSFTFMFLCSYRLNADIRSLKTYSKAERFVNTVKYILVGFSLPLLVTLSTKLTNITLGPMDKWYGGRVCFITQTLVLLLAFVLPVFLIVCGNVILIICIIHYISSTSISSRSNKSNVFVFVKISSIMGLSWIIGIIAILSHSDILLLIFELLSNLQGAFITISFSCTNRVKKFCKDCVKGSENHSSTNAKSV